MSTQNIKPISFVKHSVALLSIKPRFSDQIFSDVKRVEYRRVWSDNIRFIVVYSTLPIGKIVGLIEVDKVLRMTPSELWNVTKDFSGIDLKDFERYFQNRKVGCGILIKRAMLADQAIDPKQLDFKFSPPQSYYYLSEQEFFSLKLSFG